MGLASDDDKENSMEKPNEKETTKNENGRTYMASTRVVLP